MPTEPANAEAHAPKRPRPQPRRADVRAGMSEQRTGPRPTATRRPHQTVVAVRSALLGSKRVRAG